jgi:glucan-binding YG repeat protein
MNSLSFLKNFITIDGDKYYHYSLGGKHNATKWVSIDGVHYYHSETKPVIQTKVEVEVEPLNDYEQ